LRSAGGSLVWEEEFFSDGACILVSGIIAAPKCHAPKGKQNLVEVAAVVGSGGGLFAFCGETLAGTLKLLEAKLERFALPDDAEPTRSLHRRNRHGHKQSGLSQEREDSGNGEWFRFSLLRGP
jgi:hypothetical protein